MATGRVDLVHVLVGARDRPNFVAFAQNDHERITRVETLRDFVIIVTEDESGLARITESRTHQIRPTERYEQIGDLVARNRGFLALEAPEHVR